MRYFLSFWRQCAVIAARGCVNFANDWQWLFGIPAVLGVLSYFGEQMIFPGHPILDGVAVAFAAFIATWAVAFVVRLVNAPAKLLREAQAKGADLETKLRAIEDNRMPDFVIETRKLPEVVTRLAAGGENKGGITHIIVRDIHLTNKSNDRISLEIRLRYKLGDNFYVYPNQDDSPLQIVEVAKVRDASIGQHLGRRINIEGRQGIHGYLSYFVRSGPFDPILESLAKVSGLDITTFLDRADAEFLLTEHVAHVTRIIPARSAHSTYFFRELDAEDKRTP